MIPGYPSTKGAIPSGVSPLPNLYSPRYKNANLSYF